MNIHKIHINKDHIPLEKQKIKQVNLYGFKMKINEGHTLEYNLLKYPKYSFNLLDIHLRIKEKYPDHAIIDVGANVGDTIALIRSKSSNYIYSIEGNELYFKLLSINYTQFTNISLFNFFLNEVNESLSANISASRGTLHIIHENNGSKVDFITLDNLIIRNSIQNVKLLKIDTDGYDFKIIRGAYTFIETQKPIIFIEYDLNYLLKLNESEWDVFEKLSSIGYEDVYFYDNYGKFLIKLKLTDKLIIEQLTKYTLGEGVIKYFDICIPHKNDSDMVII
ncbi:MAG: FkbM family methyltransferase [Bacteroidota bacterium]|nr:FkbM family methyltransferase [Bacteroidota bacterium]